MKHIQESYENTSVEKWERDHRIKRTIIGDCEYVTCPNFEEFRLQCEAEEAFEFRQMVAEQQAASCGIK